MTQYSNQSHLFNVYGRKYQFNQRKMNQYKISYVLEGHKCVKIFGQNLEILDRVRESVLSVQV